MHADQNGNGNISLRTNDTEKYGLGKSLLKAVLPF